MCAEAETLDKEGFVVDFKRLVTEVLQPSHALLDHALAIGEDTWSEVRQDLEGLGERLVGSRAAIHGADARGPELVVQRLAGAENRYPGGMKVAVFPFALTSERLAGWLWRLADETIAQPSQGRVRIPWTRVYETLHPVESVAEFRPEG